MVLLCTTLSLVFGLYFLKNNVVLSVVLSVLYLIFILIRFGKKTFIISLFLFAIGATVSNVNLEYNSKNDTYSGFVIEAKTNYILLRSHFEKYYIYEESNSYEVGDYLVVTGEPSELKMTSYESQFNFKEYLNNKGVKRQLKANKIDSKFKSFIRVKMLKEKFLSKFDENSRALVDAFLFNEKDYDNQAIKFTSNLKLNHLFCLSGVYLHLIFACLTYLFSLKFSNKASELLPFIVLLPYAFFSLSKIGTLRVYSLYFLKYLNNHHFKKKRIHIELVSILALIFITFDFYLVYQESFYIGFLLSIVMPFINTALSFLNKKKRKYLISVFLNITMVPITIKDGSLNVLSLLNTSLIFVPNLIFLILAIMAIFFPVYPAVNFIGKTITWILEKMDLINISIPFGNLGGAFSYIFYFLLILGIYFLEGVRISHFKQCVILAISIVLLAIAPLQDPLINAVYFINVGQGDSILIKNRNYTVLIDTGGVTSSDIATETLIPFFNKNKITHLNALITTHDDNDHSGGKDSLIKNFKVYSYLYEATSFPYKVGNIYLENLNTYSLTDDNDKSLVLSLNFMNKKWLFMGDASTEVEKKLISDNKNIDCDILKIGHHGSKTSTCDAFLKATTPSTAIISVGEANYYGHPSDEVIERLKKYNIKIRRTDEEGTISYLSLVD